MKELLIRAISGLVYVATLAGTALWDPIAFAVVLLVLFIIANYELLKLMGPKHINNVVFITFLALIFLTLEAFTLVHFFEIQWNINKNVFYSIFMISGLLSIILFFSIVLLSIFRVKSNFTDHIKSFSLHIIYLLIPFISMLILSFTKTYSLSYPYIILLFAAIWINDTFAYLGGRLLGKTPFALKISPQKTTEGFFIGIFFTVAAFFAYNFFYPFTEQINLIVFTVLICLTATLGDLIQSKMKREAGVKDSGNIIPGHGGILDRMDSLLLTAPFTFLYSIILFP